MLAFTGTAISQHLARTPEGYLIARDVVIARTAVRTPQMYRGSEVGIANSDTLVPVYRAPSEVFSPRAMASGTAKPVVSPHPGTFLSPSNVSWYSKGVMLHLRRGQVLDDGEEALLADVVMMDPGVIAQVESGSLRECSLGYDCEYREREDGRGFDQHNILINHLALVEHARAGSAVRIRDSAEAEMDIDSVEKKLDTLIELLEQRTPAKQRTLADEVNSIVASARRTEEVTRSGVGPTAFHEALREASPAYAEFDDASTAAQSFAEQCRREGQRQQAAFRPKQCKDTVAPVQAHDSDDATEDWVAQQNRRGRLLRGR